MNRCIFSVLLALCCATTISLIAQESQKSIINSEGDHTIKTIKIDAKNSALFLKNLEGNSANVWIDEEDGEMTITADQLAMMIEDTDGPGDKIVSVNVNKEVNNGEVVRTVEIEIEEEGKHEKIKWTDNGEDIPEDIKALLKEKGISITMLDEDESGEQEIEVTIDNTDGDEKRIITNERKKAYRIKTIDDNGNEEIMEWDGEGEMPEEMKKAMRAHELEGKMKMGGNGKIHKHRMIKKNRPYEEGLKKNTNKAMLGVQISDEGEGVKILDIYKDTGAEKAGLKKGDVINSVNGKFVGSMDSLINHLSGSNPRDKVSLGILRDGKQHSIEVHMSAKKTDL